jgi:hypothetical protein
MNTVDERVRAAREQAESFIRSHQHVPAAAASSSHPSAAAINNAAEDARIDAHEEKTAVIEQLQRELASTVDALNRERMENARSMSPPVVSYPPIPPSPPAAADDGAATRVLELLHQSQEEAAGAKRELAAMRDERDRLADQVNDTMT